jgi:uncharacterized protein YfkK (UPF0435 family)
MRYILKEDRLKYRPFTSEEKLKCMDKMIKYIRNNSTAVNDRSATDIYQNCKIVALTDLFDMVVDHVIEED